MKGTNVVTVSLDGDMIDKVNRIGVGKSFSAKVKNLIDRAVNDEELLVKYEDGVDKEPILLKQGAKLIFADCDMVKGWFANEVSLEAKRIAGSSHSRKTIIEKIVPAMRKNGYLIQIIDDPATNYFEVWGMKKDVSRCSRCDIISEIALLIARWHDDYK